MDANALRTEPTEAAFLSQVIALARLCGWRVFHQRPGLTRSGRWCSATQGDGVGFPDLILVRGGTLVVAELKVGRGKATAEQVDWLDAFRATGCAAGVWRPADWPEIERALRGE